MAAPTIYRSTDTSAPTLSGTAGDLINLLNKCLVVGYGTKDPAGWSSPYGPTSNVQVFRQGGGNMRYLRVDDSGTTDARVRGWEAMGSIADAVVPQLGTIGPFPTDTQFASGLYVRKSAAASATQRAWVLIADDRTFYLLVLTGDNASVYYGFAFGDTYSYSLGGDSYNTILIARTASSNSQAGTEALCQVIVNGMGTTVGAGGHFCARSYAGTGGSVSFGKFGDAGKQVASGVAGQVETLRGNVPYPNGPDGGLWLSRVYHSDATFQSGIVRGHLRGFYQVCHAATAFADGDVFQGTGDFAGREFILFKAAGQGLVGVAGTYCIETTAWDTN